MKRTRHVSIEIEQRKLTFTLTRTGPPVIDEPALSGHESDVCPECASPCFAVAIHAPEPRTADESTLYRALQQRGLHLHVSPSGQLRICSRSLEKACFEEPKESQ